MRQTISAFPENLRSFLPGIILCLAVALPAWFLGLRFPLAGGPVFGLLGGMFLALLRPGEKLLPGIRFVSRNLLRYSIVLLGFGMNFYRILEAGSQSLLVMAATLAAAFLTAFAAGRALKTDEATTILIGVGTAVCGGSAIAAAAPVIRAEDRQIAHSVSTIFLFNLAAVFLFPPLGRRLGLTDTGFGIWAGTAVNDTSSVVAAALAWSIEAGNNIALEYAAVVKLTRTLAILPITLFLALRTARKMKKTGAESAGFSFVSIFPWFVPGFLAAALVNTLAPLPPALPEFLVSLGKFFIVSAMAAIGLSTHLGRLLRNGLKPVFLGLCCWFAVSAVSLLVQYCFSTSFA